MTLLLNSTAERNEIWKQVFEAQGEAIFTEASQVEDLAEVSVLACWTPPADLSIYPNLKAVLSVGAGVDQIQNLPSRIMLCRSVAQGIETQVRDWVVMATLMAHRDMHRYIEHAREGLWRGKSLVPNRSRRVGILGLGRIGRLVAAQLTSLGFQVSGWSRSGRSVTGVTVYSAEGLDLLLQESDILICLLPLTEETRGLLNKAAFDKLPNGAHLVHAGRGDQLNMADLKVALENGQLSTATLDVTSPEPLPEDHWAWHDPRVIVTPHIAAQTDAIEGAQHALNVVRAVRNGTHPPGLIDRNHGY